MTLQVGIEKLHQADVAATLMRDVDALTALWDDDGVLLQPGQSPVIGKTAFVEFLKQNLARSASLKVLTYAPEIRDIQVEGDVAYEWGVFNSTVSSSDLEQPTNFRARFVRILRRQLDGSWRFCPVMWAPE
jgi:ketosteroid isomerase-like protein